MSKEIWKPGNMLYPLPAVMVSAGDKAGNQNIITVAWTGTVCTNPAMLYISVRPERYKWKETRLTPEKAEKLEFAPLIGESPVNIECRVCEVKELGSHHMFLAEVCAVHVDSEYMTETGKFELNRSGLIAYSHGTYLNLGKELGTFGYSVKKK